MLPYFSRPSSCSVPVADLRPRIRLLVLGLAVLFVLFTSGTARAETDLSLHEVLSAESAEDLGVRLHLPSAGVVTFDLLERRGGATGPAAGGFLELLPGSPAPSVVSRSAERLVLAVERPGAIRLRVRTEGAFRLVHSWVPTRVVRDALGPLVRLRFVAPSSSSKAEPEEVDHDPDAFRVRPAEVLVAELLARPGTANKAEPEEVDHDPDAFDAPARRSVLSYRPTCVPATFGDPQDVRGDHAETADCATTLSRTVAGRLDDRRDDRDVFRVVLDRPSTLRIASRGTADTFGSLHDGSGRRLAVDDDGGEDRNFALVKTLAPGTYTVHVTGIGGSYELELSADLR